jgi:8-oxo-dGTP diphosphatase
MIIPVVAACIHSNDAYDKVLLTKRSSPYKEIDGKWEFSGGRVEENEKLEDALIREIYEELKIRIQVGKLLHAQVNKYPYSPDSYLVLYYDCLSEPIKEGMLPEHAWVNISDIESYNCLPGTNEAVRMIFKRG